jgi:hypothetical protein
MRASGAVLLAMLTVLAPACGCGGGSGGGAPPLVFTPLVPVDTSGPNRTIIDTTQSDSNITSQINTALAAGRLIVFNNSAPKTIVIDATLVLPAFLTAVIDGNYNGQGLITLSGNSARRILMKQFQSNLTVQRLAFVDGRATDEGGALWVENWDGNLTVIDCTFTNCKTTLADADIGGGAIKANGQRRLQVSGCTFTDCDGANGGAIGSIGSQMTLINCTFTNCNAFGTGGGGAGGDGGIGGAVYVDGVSNNSEQRRLDVVGCTFTTNSANDHGGALFVFTYPGTGSIVTIDRSTFSGNTVTDASGIALGGAVYHQENKLVVTRSTFSGNTTIKQGGAIWSICNSATIENSTFQGNQATGAPGFGGAIRISGTFLINSCTISQNHAAGWGGGIFAVNPEKGTLQNTLLMNNTGTDPGNGWNVNATLGHGSNNLQWPAGGATSLPARPDIVFADANLQALAGPAPQTMAILAGSPAVDAGNNKAPDTDQRGLPRVNAPDIGAFEKQ